jgi:hypothetical protein
VPSLLGVEGLDKTNAGFRASLYSGALARGLNPDYLAAVMSFESGFNPAIKNKYSGAVGLIQWVSDSSFADTARKAGMPTVTRADLPHLTATEQLPFVFAWYDGKGLEQSSSAIDYYLAVFMPALIGKARDYVAAREGTKAYEQNAGFDRAGKGYYTVADIGQAIEHVIAIGQTRPRVPVDLEGFGPERAPLSPLLMAALAAGAAYFLLPRITPARRALGLGAA